MKVYEGLGKGSMRDHETHGLSRFVRPMLPFRSRYRPVTPAIQGGRRGAGGQTRRLGGSQTPSASFFSKLRPIPKNSGICLQRRNEGLTLGRFSAILVWKGGAGLRLTL
jgi:hypothetical protein